MCGRFANSQSIEEQAARFDTEPPADDVQWQHSPNCAPHQQLPIVLQHHDKRLLRLAEWGFTPDWDPQKSLINARSEEAAQKTSFKEAFAQRRCLVPAVCYYEWQKTADGKQPYVIRPRDQQHFGFAGLWQTIERDGRRHGQFTILTVAASPSIAAIHERMPVILAGGEEDQWLEEGLDSDAVQHICDSYPDDQLFTAEISSAINAPRCQDWSVVEEFLG